VAFDLASDYRAVAIGSTATVWMLMPLMILDAVKTRKRNRK
jgi:hypothetical protein